MPKPRIASPPIKWLAARKRSAEKLRSTNWLAKNIARMAEMGKAKLSKSCCHELNPRPASPKKPKLGGSQAPQMKNSRNIITESLKRMPGRSAPLGLANDPAEASGDSYGFLLMLACLAMKSARVSICE